MLFAAATMQSARMELIIVDHAGKNLPARVHISDEAGKEYAPERAVPVTLGPDRWFASDGRVLLEVPEGVLRVQVERGPEYVPLREEIRVAGAVQRRLVLRRWTDMRARGYRSGENHLHVATADLAPMLAAEDLDFGNSLHWWNAGGYPYRRHPKR